MPVETLELRVTTARQIVMAEEMLSIKALAERRHCSPRTVERIVKRYRDTGGKSGLAHVGVEKRLRIPAKAANRYAASDDFLRS